MLRKHITRRRVRIADTTQLNTLAQVKTFLKWCVKQGWIKSNPAPTWSPRGATGTASRS
jgi:hypothetical protein